jgi:hypothetical protein
LVRLGAGGRLEQAYTVSGKRELLGRIEPGDGLLAAWTGGYRADVFWVDDLAVVRDALS